MATKQEILNLVGHQLMVTGSDNNGVLYLTINDYTVTTPTLSVKPAVVECSLTEDEMISEVESLLESFPVYQIDSSLSPQLKEIEELRVGNEIAKNALRGAGYTRFKNSLYYRGDTVVDAPIIVAENDGKYGIFKHPNFERYGFVLEQ